MKQLIAFTRKEFTELVRTGKFMIMLIVFVLFGIMNPAMAKMTPWLYDMLADTMAEQGVTIAQAEVTALTSWMQFYKNISMVLIVLVIMFCGILTSEYQKGTLINMLTKGLSRWKVIVAKSIGAISLWSLCYWLCFGITYAYNAYFWDNSIAFHLFPAAACIYLFGIWLISLIMISSSTFDVSFAVLLISVGVIAIVYLISVIPAISEYLPTQLLNSGNMLSGVTEPSDFMKAIFVTIGLSVIQFILAILQFNKKKI